MNSRSRKRVKLLPLWPECRGSVGVEGQGYNPCDYYNTMELRQVIDSCVSYFSCNPDLFKRWPLLQRRVPTPRRLVLGDSPQHTVTRRTGLECRFSTWLGRHSLTALFRSQEIWKVPVKIEQEVYQQEAAGLKVKESV